MNREEWLANKIFSEFKPKDGSTIKTKEVIKWREPKNESPS